MIQVLGRQIRKCQMETDDFEDDTDASQSHKKDSKDIVACMMTLIYTVLDAISPRLRYHQLRFLLRPVSLAYR